MNAKYKSILIFLSVFLLSLQACAQFNDNTPVVSPSDVYRMLENGENILVVDVRTEGEYTGELGHIESAILRPLQEIDNWKNELNQNNYDKIIMVCRSGNRSGVASQAFLKESFENVYNMSGGMREWNKQGLPVVKGQNTGEDQENGTENK
jgi:rhodanese-related sulfurtransferase